MAGDAQTYPFPTGGFAVALNHFGIMFFENPVAAFSNPARALASGGRLAFVCWQDLLSNPFVAGPGLAAAQRIELPDLGPPDAPGMFALADPVRVRSLLADAGFVDVVVESLNEEILSAPRHAH